MDPPSLYELMRREQVDCAEFVPAVATLLFEHVESLGESLDFMRVLIVSSEAWRNDKATLFKRLCGPDTRLINAYGLTEATIDSTYFELDDPGERSPERFVPIGRPLANTKVYVLDANLEPVADRGPGRAVRRRRRRRARLSQPSRADARAVRSRPVRDGARRHAVPHGRPRALARRTATSSSSAAPTAR